MEEDECASEDGRERALSTSSSASPLTSSTGYNPYAAFKLASGSLLRGSGPLAIAPRTCCPWNVVLSSPTVLVVVSSTLLTFVAFYASLLTFVFEVSVPEALCGSDGFLFVEFLPQGMRDFSTCFREVVFALPVALVGACAFPLAWYYRKRRAESTIQEDRPREAPAIPARSGLPSWSPFEARAELVQFGLLVLLVVTALLPRLLDTERAPLGWLVSFFPRLIAGAFCILHLAADSFGVVPGSSLSKLCRNCLKKNESASLANDASRIPDDLLRGLARRQPLQPSSLGTYSSTGRGTQVIGGVVASNSNSTGNPTGISASSGSGSLLVGSGSGGGGGGGPVLGSGMGNTVGNVSPRGIAFSTSPNQFGNNPSRSESSLASCACSGLGLPNGDSLTSQVSVWAESGWNAFRERRGFFQFLENASWEPWIELWTGLFSLSIFLDRLYVVVPSMPDNRIVQWHDRLSLQIAIVFLLLLLFRTGARVCRRLSRAEGMWRTGRFLVHNMGTPALLSIAAAMLVGAVGAGMRGWAEYRSFEALGHVAVFVVSPPGLGSGEGGVSLSTNDGEGGSSNQMSNLSESGLESGWEGLSDAEQDARFWGAVDDWTRCGLIFLFCHLLENLCLHVLYAFAGRVFLQLTMVRFRHPAPNLPQKSEDFALGMYSFAKSASSTVAVATILAEFYWFDDQILVLVAFFLLPLVAYGVFHTLSEAFYEKKRVDFDEFLTQNATAELGNENVVQLVTESGRLSLAHTLWSCCHSLLPQLYTLAVFPPIAMLAFNRSQREPMWISADFVAFATQLFALLRETLDVTSSLGSWQRILENGRPLVEVAESQNSARAQSHSSREYVSPPPHHGK